MWAFLGTECSWLRADWRGPGMGPCSTGHLNGSTYKYGTIPYLLSYLRTYLLTYFCADGRRINKPMYVDETTSLVVAGCLCVVAASSVIIVILLVYRTFCSRRTLVRLPPVLLPQKSRGAWNSSVDSSTTRLTNSGNELLPDGDDVDYPTSAIVPHWLGRITRQSFHARVKT